MSIDNNTNKQKKNTQRHPLRGRFLPIHSGWANYISGLKRKNETPARHSDTKPTKLAKIMLTTMIVLGVVQSGNSQYTIKHPEPGLYIEHIGRAMAKRGTLRIELNLPLNTTAEKERMNNIVNKMNSTCKQSNRFAGETHCATLMEHLSDRRHAIINEIEILESKQNKETKIRSKRGMFGRLLQTVFGVNDEIYTDIETLEQNQQLLRQATNHQANIMLSMMTRINESEAQSIQKINLITKKLNKVITEVNKIEGWYDKIDGNKVGIQILAVYQIALDMFENIEKHYIKLLEATLGRRSLLDFVTPSKLKDIISKAASKMPINLRILSEPGPKLETSMNDTNIIIYGYLPIVEMDEYDLIKATPIPKKVKNNTYIAADISSSLLATNFNTQQYFEVSEEEFRQCIITEKHLTLCTPTVISNIETNANCIIDEIYQRHEKHNCPIKEFKTPKVIWKHLFMVNTWLFIADTPTSAAIKCNGNREDVILSGVGILQISQDCLIQTKKNTLYSEIHHRTQIKSTFVKPINLNVTWINNQQPSNSQMSELEPILKTSDRFFSISHDSEKLLTSSAWKKIGPHATTATSSVCITLIIIVIIWNCKSRGWTQRIKNWKPNNSARVKNDAPLPTTNFRTETPDFTIHPCEYSTHTSRPFPTSRQQPIYARPAECSQVNKTTGHQTMRK